MVYIFFLQFFHVHCFLWWMSSACQGLHIFPLRIARSHSTDKRFGSWRKTSVKRMLGFGTRTRGSVPLYTSTNVYIYTYIITHTHKHMYIHVHEVIHLFIQLISLVYAIYYKIYVSTHTYHISLHLCICFCIIIQCNIHIIFMNEIQIYNHILRMCACVCACVNCVNVQGFHVRWITAREAQSPASWHEAQRGCCQHPTTAGAVNSPSWLQAEIGHKLCKFTQRTLSNIIHT